MYMVEHDSAEGSTHFGGVMHNAESVSKLWCTLGSLTQTWDSNPKLKKYIYISLKSKNKLKML